MKTQKDKALLKRLGLHVRKLRKQKELSYRKLSALCDLEHHRIYEIEQGRINITFTTLIELASGLDVDPAELLKFLKD
jgi:transcriptional regulator with XRE-family HTH domain